MPISSMFEGDVGERPATATNSAPDVGASARAEAASHRACRGRESPRSSVGLETERTPDVRIVRVCARTPYARRDRRRGPRGAHCRPRCRRRWPARPDGIDDRARACAVTTTIVGARNAFASSRASIASSASAMRRRSASRSTRPNALRPSPSMMVKRHGVSRPWSGAHIRGGEHRVQRDVVRPRRAQRERALSRQDQVEIDRRAADFIPVARITGDAGVRRRYPGVRRAYSSAANVL